jgi:hypothetical protein
MTFEKGKDGRIDDEIHVLRRQLPVRRQGLEANNLCDFLSY